VRLYLPTLKAFFIACPLLVPASLATPHAASAPSEPFSGMIAQVKRAVVVVNSFDARGRLISQGSGFFVRDGHIVTNLHVIGRASRVEIKTFSGQTLAVEGVVALEQGQDLVLLQLDESAEEVTVLPVADAPPRAGEEVFVVSNPHGSPWEVSRGAALGSREFPELGRLMPITAPISQGSSGGPVVNLQGRVVGVATMGLRASVEQYFALPGEYVAHLRPSPLRPFPLLPKE
jgi:serine protease Do